MRSIIDLCLSTQSLLLVIRAVRAATLPLSLSLKTNESHSYDIFPPHFPQEYNHTLSLEIPGGAPLPSDPYEYLVPYTDDPGITVKFYHYGPRRLLPVRVIGTLQAAIRDRDAHQDVMGTQERLYEDGDVVLLLHPKPDMVWYDWGVAIKGLFHFTQTYENVEMYYDIFEEGVGLIGTGALSEW